ncbi:hypothetical protein EBU95_17420 [bacterium]|nr:hypothetical protein [bacterium]
MIDKKTKTVSIGKSELKGLLREVVKEMAQSGELSRLLTESVSANGIPVTIPNQQPVRQQPVDPRISAFAAAAAKNPMQQQMLEGIFTDTLANTVPAQQYGENMVGQTGMYGGGMNYPQPPMPVQSQMPVGYNPMQMQPVAAPAIGYIGEQDQSGFVGYQPPTTTQLQQSSNMHPMARMAFKHPLKNRLE